ncbi:MAG: squalene/phytoene synthase family protein [Chlorobi bacterium]|nr:squalene/phytoene synthase family protein [Chlorobiota bacterium]
MALPHQLRQQLLGQCGSAIVVSDDRQAYRFCRQIAFHHYENFPVVSLALGEMRDDIAAIYAFARLADDIADEWDAPTEAKLAALDMLDSWLDSPLLHHPIGRAVASTIERNRLPRETFRRLLRAFRYDAAFVPFETERLLEDYCSNSAAPIGELLLRLAGRWSEQSASLSDAFCAGLQVLNFWQDISNDWQRGRVTAPLEWLGSDSPPLWDELLANPRQRFVLAQRYDEMVTRLLASGTALAELLPRGRLRLQVRVTWTTAHVIWHRCRQRGVNFEVQPRLRWIDIGRILGALVFR